MAVRETESSILAFEIEEMKFEILPPGQEATRIIPKAIIGDMRSPRAIARRKVKAGSSRNWHNAPIRTPLGFLKTSIKTVRLQSSLMMMMH